MAAPDLDYLTLRPAEVRLQIIDGNRTRRPVSHFLDFVVNGQSLLALTDTGGSRVTTLNRPWLPVVSEAVDILLGRREQQDLAPGRVVLLVCALRGDLGCVP